MSDKKTDPASSKKSLEHLSPEVVGKLSAEDLYNQKRFLELAHHQRYLKMVPASHIQGLMGWVDKNKGKLSPEEYESAQRSLQAALRAKESAEQMAADRQTDSPEDQFVIIDRLLQAYSFEGTEEDEEIVEEAIQRCRAGIVSEPGNAGFYRRRAEAYLLQERFDKTLADYTRAIELEPSNVEYHLARAGFHGHQEPDEALRGYDKAIELDPSCWEAYEGRGSVLLGVDREGSLPDLDRAERALPDLLKAIELVGRPGARSVGYPPPPPSTPVAQLSKARLLIYQIALAFRQRAERHLAAGDGAKALTDGIRVLALVHQAQLQNDDILSWVVNLLAKASSSTKTPLPAGPAKTSWPGQVEVPADKPVFSGDGPCPKCKTMLWIDWKLIYDTMTCPGCDFEFDGAAAISIVTSHEPDKNSGDFGRVRELIKMKKELVILGQQMTALPAPPEEPPLPSPPGEPSRQSTIAAMTDVAYHALLQQAKAAQQLPESQRPRPRRVVRRQAQPTPADIAMLLDDIALAGTDQLMAMMRLEERMR